MSNSHPRIRPLYISSLTLDFEDSRDSSWLEEMIPYSIAGLEATRHRITELDDNDDGDDNNSSHCVSPTLPMNNESLQECESEDSEVELTDQTPPILTDLEAGTHNTQSEFDDSDDDIDDDNEENASDDGPSSLPLYASSVEADVSLDAYETETSEEGVLTEQTPSSWLQKMIPSATDLETGSRRTFEYNNDSDDENDSRDATPGLPTHAAPMNDDSSEGYESEDTDDGLIRGTPTRAAIAAQMSQ
jgi:hypothetical protein